LLCLTFPQRLLLVQMLYLVLPWLLSVTMMLKANGHHWRFYGLWRFFITRNDNNKKRQIADRRVTLLLQVKIIFFKQQRL
jgi:hypothetical protein